MTERDLFMAALQIDDPAARRAYLDEACAGDADLRGRVDALLVAHDRAGTFMGQPAAAGFTAADLPPTADRTGTVVGPYKLVERIGEGGMGEVWMAQQTEPVKRLVAVKLVKPGMDSRAVLARFEAERQALALMDHPNIAKVHDAGATADGRPYFVMELVKGVPITRYCDDRRLAPRQRLELFVPVCQAVQHAHQKGIIHRDLKPSNVLVAEYDERPVPKVIDFGVAKAAGQPLTEKTLHTGFGAVVGTLEYMSPEQAKFNALDIDTRSDIYSLGVLLYEMLAGSPPFGRRELEAAGLDEMLRVIREKEPSKPSTKLSSDERLPSLAAERGTEPARLAKQLRGELDWIVMKALEKDRGRRYETANGFARDIQRYLADEPVEARPPSAGYRLGKFLRRNKGAVLAASLVFLALVAGIAGTTWGMMRARAAEADAVREAGEKELARQAAEASATAERAAKDQTQKRLTQIEKGVDLLASLLTDINPRHETKGGPTVYERVRRRAEAAADQLDGEAVGDPLAVARLQIVLGTALSELGGSVKAIDVLTKALATNTASLGADHADTLTAMLNLANAYRTTGRTDRAIPLLEKLRAVKLAKHGPDHPSSLIAGNNLALAYLAVRRAAEALPILEQVRDGLTAKFGADAQDTLMTRDNLAGAYFSLGRTAEAVRECEAVRDARLATLGADHPATLNSLNNLAMAYGRVGRTAEAIALYEQSRDGRMARFGPDHPELLTTVDNLAAAYWSAGRPADAVTAWEFAAAGVAKRDFQHVYADNILRKAIRGLAAAGKLDRSDDWQRRWLAALKQRSGADSPAYADELAIFGSNLLGRQAWADAEPILRDCLRIRAAAAPDAWPTASARSMLGAALLGLGKPGEAEPLLLAGYDGLKEQAAAIPGPSRLNLPTAALRLVRLYEATGRPAEAAALLDEAWAWAE